MISNQTAAEDNGFTARFARSVERYQHEKGFVCTIDVLFLGFLREVERFGYFHLGPITIDVRVVEEAVEATGEVADTPHHDTEDWVVLSQLLVAELRRSGRQRIDELHYLFAFMRCGRGIPARVFGELGVTPEQVETYLREGPTADALPERWMTPEEVADYLRVHVQTVRAWIRAGKLPARRVYGMRSLRVKMQDAARMLRPIDEPEEMGL